MTKFRCDQRGCQFAPCVIDVSAAMPDELMIMCPVEEEADWTRVKEVAKDQAVLFL